MARRAVPADAGPCTSFRLVRKAPFWFWSQLRARKVPARIRIRRKLRVGNLALPYLGPASVGTRFSRP